MMNVIIYVVSVILSMNVGVMQRRNNMTSLVEIIKEKVLDRPLYLSNSWIPYINVNPNKYIQIEREDKPMKKNLKEKMHDEMNDLSCKMIELKELQESDASAYLNEEDKELVSAQLNAMNAYYNILNVRYRRLKGDYK